jgi:putative ABC transport system permease protein
MRLANLFGSGMAGAAVPLARRNLSLDKWRLFRSTSGIGFAVFLMLVELGFQTAFFDSTLNMIRCLDADIIVISSAKYQFAKKTPFSRRLLYEARGVDGVGSARPVYAEWTRSTWKSPDDQRIHAVQVLGFDPDEPVFLLPEVNSRLTELRRADTVMIDDRGRRHLGQPRAGILTELARRNVEVIGTFSLGPDFFIDGTVITSDRNFAKLFGNSDTAIKVDGGLSDRPDVEFGLVKVASGAGVPAVQKALKTALSSSVAILTKQQFIDKEKTYQTTYSPAGPIFVLGTLIGFAVGLMISYQVLFSDISDQISQYATLKAMGFSNAFLTKVVLQQAAFYAVVAYLPAWLLCAVLFQIVGAILLLPMRMTLSITTVSFALTLGMCLVSGLIAVRRVIRADPAEVF